MYEANTNLGITLFAKFFFLFFPLLSVLRICVMTFKHQSLFISIENQNDENQFIHDTNRVQINVY